MRHSSLFLLAAGCVHLCVGQESGWAPNQVNATMCFWTSPRAAVVRDTVYIDGGSLYWAPGMSNGSYGLPTNDGNPLGLVYQLNFSSSFDTDRSKQNISNVFTRFSKAPGGSGNANNFGPLYIDGTMLANDYEWYIYGGLLTYTDAYTPPSGSDVLYYQVHPTVQRQFQPGFGKASLPDGVTRYVTYGGGVSVPSENLGFYFSGLRAANDGPIYYTYNETVNADQLSTTLIQLNMTIQQQEMWKNFTLPTTVPGRANPELVWIPVSKRGVLIAIGGVINPEYATLFQLDNVTQIAESEKQSPAFMKTVSVYDIDNQVWYEQDTSGDPPGQLTQGCTVVASAQDGSSHNIYWYGGFEGTDATQAFSDAVWVLSVPSFVWTQVSSGTSTHARAGHKCVKPYPDQMLVIGGYAALGGDGAPPCVAGNIVQIYNLNSNTWVESYNPTTWSNYTVPQAIYSKIGGSGTGGATQTTPSPSGFSNSSLAAVFKTPYDTAKITSWYPYSPSPTSTTRPTLLPTPVSKNGTPAYVAPVVGVIGGLFVLTVIIIGILVWRRRRLLKIGDNGAMSEAGTMDNRNLVARWLWGTPAAGEAGKAPTVTTDETVPASPYDEHQPYVPEVQGAQIHEMADTSKPSELHATDTGFVPLAGAKNSHNRHLSASPSTASSISQPSSPIPASPQLPVGQNQTHLSGPSSRPAIGRIASGVSNLSDSDRGHLRQLSDTSVSTVGAEAEENVQPVVSPVSPGAGAGLGPESGVKEKKSHIQRKSNFSEGLDESEKGTGSGSGSGSGSPV